MRVRPLYGRKGIWLREYADTGEGTTAGILSTASTYGGCSNLSLKVADSLDLVGTYDPSTPVKSLDDLTALRDACKAAGFTFLPVVVPRGRPGEAAFHGQIAQRCGALMVDIEPYAGSKKLPLPMKFWDQGPTSNIPQYWKDLRAAAGDAYLMAQPDPRQYGWSGAYVQQSLPYFDALCCQHYVGWMGAGWTDVAAEVKSVARDFATGKDVYVTIYGADPSFPLQQNLPGQFWQQVQPNVLGLNIFAFGPMNGKQLNAVRDMPAPAVPPEPIDPQPAPAQGQRERLALWSASNAADLLDTDLADSDVLPRVLATSQSIVKELQQ